MEYRTRQPWRPKRFSSAPTRRSPANPFRQEPHSVGRRRSRETTRSISPWPHSSSRSRKARPGGLTARSSAGVRGGSTGRASVSGALSDGTGSVRLCKCLVSKAITSSRHSARRSVMSPVATPAQPTAVPSGRLAYRRSCPYRFQRVTCSSAMRPSAPALTLPTCQQQTGCGHKAAGRAPQLSSAAPGWCRPRCDHALWSCGLKPEHRRRKLLLLRRCVRAGLSTPQRACPCSRD